MSDNGEYHNRGSKEVEFTEAGSSENQPKIDKVSDRDLEDSEDSQLIQTDPLNPMVATCWEESREVILKHYPQRIPTLITFIDRSLTAIPTGWRKGIPKEVYREIVVEIFLAAGMPLEMAENEYLKVELKDPTKYTIRTIFDFLNMLMPLTLRQSPPPEVLTSYYVFLERKHEHKRVWVYAANSLFAFFTQTMVIYFLYTVWYYNVKGIFDNRETQFPRTAYFCIGILVLFLADDVLNGSASSSLLPLSTFKFRPIFTSETASITFQTPASLAILCCGTVFLLTTRDGLGILFNCGAFVIFMQIDGICIYLFARLTNLNLDIHLLHPRLQKFTTKSSRVLIVILLMICFVGAMSITLSYKYPTEGEITKSYRKITTIPGQFPQSSTTCCSYVLAEDDRPSTICTQHVGGGECCGAMICLNDVPCQADGDSNMAICLEDPNPIPYQLATLVFVAMCQLIVIIAVRMLNKKERVSKIPFVHTESYQLEKQNKFIYRSLTQRM